jgi:hypothetical protein
MKTNKRKPLATGKGILVGVRLQPSDLTALDHWIRRDGRHRTRPEAIRQLVNTGLAIAEMTRGLAASRSPLAIELAGFKIDLLLDPDHD